MTDDAADLPRPDPAWAGGPPPPPPGGVAPPPAPAGTTPPGYGQSVPPPPGTAGFTWRYGLVRPLEDRYLAGVCAAIGRATGTDPILWRVLLAVLGFFAGIGILIYVTAWLIIPREGDTASPLESMLGRGRSSMSPITVIALGLLVAVGFGFIVTDAFRAILLGAAILIGGALLLNREMPTAPGGPPPSGATPAPPPGPVPPVGYPAPAHFPAPGRPPAPEPATHQAPAAPLAKASITSPQPTDTPPPWLTAPVNNPPTQAAGPPPVPGGYRPAFAPRGPYAGPPPTAIHPPVPPPVARPNPPRERSPLGAATFSVIFVAVGVLAVLDLADVVTVPASAYFATALVTIALGLLVGAWFGRARWLIALGLVATAALGVATAAESYDRLRQVRQDVTWAPPNYAALDTRYEHTFGDAVLDLRGVDFSGKEAHLTVAVSFGQATVLVPPNVDVTAVADVKAGGAQVFGDPADRQGEKVSEITDLGADGAGGGKLHLYIKVKFGNLEVVR